MSSDFPRSACHALIYLIGQLAVSCSSAAHLSVCRVVLYIPPARHTRLVADYFARILASMSRGCYEDATRKLLPLNSSFYQLSGRRRTARCAVSRNLVNCRTILYENSHFERLSWVKDLQGHSMTLCLCLVMYHRYYQIFADCRQVVSVMGESAFVSYIR